MLRSILYIFLANIIISCSSDNLSQEKIKSINPIPVPNETEKYMSSFISKIEYFSFPEQSSVTRIDKAQVFEENYIFADFDISYSVSIIDKDMNFVANIQKFGEGPGEYLVIHDFTINRDRRTIDILSLKKLIRYDFLGNFIDEFKLPGVFTKIQHIDKESYMLYRPSATHKDLISPDNNSILWIWDVKTNEITNIPSPVEEIKLPFFKERNNLNFQDGKILFSANFLDTIYSYNLNGKLINKNYFTGKNKYLPYDLMAKTKGRLTPEQKSEYYYHHANLLEDNKHIISRLIFNGYLTNIIYFKEKEQSILFSKTENDIDGGYNYIMPVILNEGYLISTLEAPYLVERFENKNESDSSSFNSFAEKLTINSPLVLMKYHLK